MLNWIEVLKSFKDKREAVALVTVTKCLGSTPCIVSSRMIVTKERMIHGTIGGGKIEFLVIEEAIKALDENRIIELSYTLGPEFEQCCGGQVELIIESMNQTPQLFLFGAGHVGVEISKLLVDTPFETHLIDSRERWISNLQLDDSIKGKAVDQNDFKSFNDAVQWGRNCYILILTHDHALDFDIIAMALKNETKYIGLIGSKTKRVRFHNMLVKDFKLKDGMSNVFCPIGLEIGGDSPKEIAISVVAQLIQEYYKSN